MEKLAVEGLGTSFSRVQEIQNNITRQLCQQYHDEGIVCPKNIEKGLFTVAAIVMKMTNHLLLQLNVRFIEQVYQYTKGMKEIYLIRSFFYENKTHFK